LSKETEHLKLFKYDKETDDFNTTTFNVQQALNDNWDKIDVGLADKTTQITDIKSKDQEQDEKIKYIEYKLQFATMERSQKDEPTGLFGYIVWKTKDNKVIMSSQLVNRNSDGLFTKQRIAVYYPAGSSTNTQYEWNLIYNSEGEFIGRKLI
jgi:hypothetical protein